MGKNSSSDIKDNIIDFFNTHASECMNLLDIADSSDMEQIYEYNNNVIPRDLENLFAETDVLILTANKYETNILHFKISGKLKKNSKICKFMLSAFGSNYFFYFFSWGKYKVVHIMANATGSNTIDGAEDMIRLAFRYEMFRPLAVISFGICFGIDCKTQRLGDVIISKKIYSYGVGIKIKGNRIEISDDNNFILHNLLRNNIHELTTLNVISESNREFFGNYITGEVVMSSEALKQKVIQSATKSKIMAGEMEGYGVFKECTRYGRDGRGREIVPCIIIKAICDWGAKKNGFMETLDIKKSNRSKIENVKEVRPENIELVETYLEKKGNKGEYLSTEIEEVIKNSIQAFAAEKAFETCDKLFDSEIYVFGIKLYLKACDYIKNYLQKENNVIFKETLFNGLKCCNEDVTECEVNELIYQLIDNKILIKTSGKNMYRINDETR